MRARPLHSGVMPHKLTPRPLGRTPGTISPVRVFLLVLAVVFAVECSIMLLLWAGAGSERDGLVVSVLDAVLLVAVLCPALWLLVVRPLRLLVNERGELLVRTMTVQEEERAKLARDLHDEIGQTQTAILLALRSVTNAPSIETARERAEYVHEMAVGAVESTRRIARGLSPSVLMDFGLGPAVERVCEDVAEASGIPIERRIATNSARLAHALEIGAYRVFQEALTNAVKHSGATVVRVAVTLADDRLRLTVADNGRGIAARPERAGGSGGGLGLAGMRERVVLLGGEFHVSSTQDGGTTVAAVFPAKAVGP